MPWMTELNEQLIDNPTWGYQPDGPMMSEPTALATLYLTAAAANATRTGRSRLHQAALRGGEWLANIQQSDGAVGISATEATPTWPTHLAVMAWHLVDRLELANSFRTNVVKGRRRILGTISHTHEQTSCVGHDTMLMGWPWAEGTHAWIEPTSLGLLALSRTGMGQHPRAKEAARLLLDRQLPNGGCNYGNTYVLNQRLLPHWQPSGLAAIALAAAGESTAARTVKTVAYLHRNWPSVVGTSSTCYVAMGLAAHGQSPRDANDRLQTLYEKCIARGASVYQLSLLGLAALGETCPLVDNYARDHSARITSYETQGATL